MNNLNEQNITYSKSDNLLKDARQIIERTRKYAYNAINIALVQRNWLLGKRIAEEELQGENRAKYGEEIIETLSKELTKIYGKGFDYSSLYKYSKFYKLFPEILDSLSPKFTSKTLFNILTVFLFQFIRQICVAHAVHIRYTITDQLINLRAIEKIQRRIQ